MTTFEFVPDELLPLLTSEEQEWYRKALINHEVKLSPLDALVALEPGTRAWPHLVLLNELLLALFEYRLTADGPVSREDAHNIRWWYTDMEGNTHPADGPSSLPDDAQDYGGTYLHSAGEAAAGEGRPIVFRLAVSMRPRAGKSHIITEMLPRWLLMQDPNVDVLVGTYSDDFAKEWGGKFRDAAVRYRKDDGLDFLPYPREGERAPKEVFLPSEGKGSVRFVGVGGGVTGKTANVLIGDDFIKNDKDAQSEAVRKEAHDFYTSTWTTRKTSSLEPGAKWPVPLEILMGTRWHADDPIGRFAHGEDGTPRHDWYVLNIPAISEGAGDPLGRPEGVAHPSAGGESATQLLARRAEDPRIFSALYQGRPSPKGGGTLPAELSTYRYLPGSPGALEWVGPEGTLRVEESDLVTFASVDMAASAKTSADYTVLLVWGYSRQHDVLFLRRHFRDRVPPADYHARLDPLLDGVPLLVTENITFGKVFGEAQAARGIQVEYAPSGADKVAKALSSGAPARILQGRLRVPHDALWVPALESELGLFPHDKHDDQVDAVAMASWHVLTNLPRWVGPAPEPARPTTIGALLAAEADRPPRRRRYPSYRR